MLTEYLKAHPLDVHYVTQFPLAADRQAWEGIAPEDRAELLALAEEWAQKPYPVLTAGMYAAFVRTGSRRDCEKPYFARRVKLCAAALRACLLDERDDLQDVEDGLMLICEETAWAISAHAELTAAHPFPDDRRTIIDLFAAQTAMVLSFVCQLLADRLHPDLTDRVRREVERRVLSPFMTSNEEWWMGYVRTDLCNWTPWIISNVFMSANVWHYGGAALIERGCMMLDRWLRCVPEDGGCDEGAGYWNMAGGAFLDCLMLLEASCGVDLWANGKLRRMMAYPEKMYLGNGWFANFADCDARPFISGERLQFAGRRTDDPALEQMGRQMRGSLARELSDTPHLSRLLMRLFSEKAAPEAAAAPAKDVWLPDLQVRLVEGHDRCLTPGGVKALHLIAAMKGGHNGESHNHNDVGSFLIYGGGDMQVVDAGNMVYTARTFSDRRYEQWNCRSIYHNVPVIGGYEQQPGTQYAARSVERLDNGMSLDLAGAYPEEAGILRCWREMCLTGSRFSVRDEISLEQPLPVTWVFMLRDEPVLEPEDDCCHGRNTGFFIEWRENGPLTPRVEEMEITDARMQGSYPGRLWRLTLTAESSCRHALHVIMQL